MTTSSLERARDDASTIDDLEIEDNFRNKKACIQDPVLLIEYG